MVYFLTTASDKLNSKWTIVVKSSAVIASVAVGYVAIKYATKQIKKYLNKQANDTSQTIPFRFIHQNSMHLLQQNESKCTLINTAMQTEDIILPKSIIKRIIIPQLDISTIRHSLLMDESCSEYFPNSQRRPATAPIPSRISRQRFSSTDDYISNGDSDQNDNDNDEDEYKVHIEFDYSTSEMQRSDKNYISNANNLNNNAAQSVRNSAHSLSLLIRSQSETKLDWNSVFEQHIKEDIEEIADNLPIVIGEDIETEALKVVNQHIAKRLSRLFRKYCQKNANENEEEEEKKEEVNADMVMNEASFEQLVKDYLLASKVWVPKYIQTVTMIKLRYSVAQLQHSADYDPIKIGSKVSGIIAPYLLECFKVIESQIEDMSQPDEIEFIRRFCFEQMCKDHKNGDEEEEKGKFIDCKSFVTLFPTLMESLFEFSKLIPAFRERVSKTDIDIVLNEHIKNPQQGDDLLDDEQFVERWIMALEEIEKDESN